jgi:hypothetical protein
MSPRSTAPDRRHDARAGSDIGYRGRLGGSRHPGVSHPPTVNAATRAWGCPVRRLV